MESNYLTKVIELFETPMIINKFVSDPAYKKKRLVDVLADDPTVVWNKKVPNTNLEKFRKIVEKKYNQHFDSYWDFHKWSVEHYLDFWKEIYGFFGVVASRTYVEVLQKTGSGFLDNRWFPGARLNFAENILRIRDSTVALMCLDEFLKEDTVTFAEMFEEVKRYAAAFRKLGLTVGDTVGCILTNRKEAIFAMLATVSIGAIWGGALPMHGTRALSNMLKFLEPKILISVDYFQFFGDQHYPIEKLATITKSVPSLEKVIILADKEESIPRLKEIPNSILLEDFLEIGKNADGSTPELVFEQLPFDHPVSMNFTSGTTGIAKGVVHSAVTFIAILRDFALHMNLKKDDVIYTDCPVGWGMWNNPIPTLSLGVKLFVFNGCADYNLKGVSFWDYLSRYKCTYACLSTGTADWLESLKIIPDRSLDLDSLKIILIGSSPPKRKNYEFMQSCVRRDIFVAGIYDATEVFGAFSGFDLNSPLYTIECQVPALGVNLQVFNRDGKSVVGQIGEVVITNPSPSFPLYLWKDEGNVKLKETYLSKFPNVWSQNDEGWINPQTKGIAVIGRSDDTLVQWGATFRAADVYFGVEKMEELDDYICVGQKRWDGDNRAVLFVKLKEGFTFTPELRKKIATTIEREVSFDCVPRLILETPYIPYNLNHKRMESAVKKILATNTIPDSISNVINRDSLRVFLDIPEIINYSPAFDTLEVLNVTR